MSVFNWAFRLVARATLAAFVLAAVGLSAANAQQSQAPNASAFLANPGQLLQQNPNGGALLSNAVQQLVLTDPSTFKVILGLLANASDLQKNAIAQGLVQAAKVEVLTDQALAADWQRQIAAIEDPIFKTAAINAFGDVKLGAVGGAAGGDAGAGLGGPGSASGGGGSVQDIHSSPTATNPFNFTGGVAGSGVSTSTTTIINPVSASGL